MLTEAQFTDEHKVLDEYHPSSVLSIVVFNIALLLAVIALVNYKLVALPIIGSLLCLIMLIRMHTTSHDYRPQAYMFVVAGLLVCLFATALPLTYQTLRYRHLEAIAVEHSRTWLDLVTSGKTLEAYEMSLEMKDRMPPGTDLRLVHGNVDDPSDDLQKYLNMQPEKTLRELGEDAELTLEKVEYYRPHNRHDMFEVHYRLHRTQWEKDDFVFAMLMQRTRPLGDKDVFWEFRKLVPIRPPFARSSRKIGVVGGQEMELID